MFDLYADGNSLVVHKRDKITSGSKNVYQVRFWFSEDWDDLAKTAVFKAGKESYDILLNDTGVCVVPWETTMTPYQSLKVGIYGTKDDEIILPTVWADLGIILKGTSLGSGSSKPPTPNLWEQKLAAKGDGLAYDEGYLSLMSGDTTLSTVQIVAGGGGPAYRFGHGFKQDGLDVSVDTVSDFSGDNTLPMTAAGVQATVGNIEALLATI